MIKSFFLSLCILFCIAASAQTQQGYVKTKGRMVNGKLVPGQGLKGATVSIKGRTTVLVNSDDGTFSFPVTEATYCLESVKKKGYQLVDMETCPRTYKPSPNPLYIVMETLEQQETDQLTAERKIRRNLQKQLEEKEDEIENLKAQHKISEEEYRNALQKLYQDQENNERLISDMAKRYSKLDYDQLDEFYRQVSYCIENGDLVKADSLLNSRGDINQQVNEILQHGQALQEEKEQLQKAEAMQKADIEEAAQRCYSYYETYIAQYQNDTAAYFLELRAKLDTTNAQWQADAALLYHFQNQIEKAELYIQRAVALFRDLTKENPEDYQVSFFTALSDLGALYVDLDRFEEATDALTEAADIARELAKDNSPENKLELVDILSLLSEIYLYDDHVSESETVLLEAMKIIKPMAKRYSYDPYVLNIYASVLGEMGVWYYYQKQYSECEDYYKQSLDISRKIAKKDPDKLYVLVSALDHLVSLYTATREVEKRDAAFNEQIGIRRQLAKRNPKAYEPDLAISLFSYASDAIKESKALDLEAKEEEINEKQFQESVAYLEEALELFRKQPHLAATIYWYQECLSTLADAAFVSNGYDKSLLYMEELLPFKKEEYLEDPATNMTDYADHLEILSSLCIIEKEFQKAENYALVTLSVDSSRLGVNANLAPALLLQGKYDQAEEIYLRYKDKLGAVFLDELETYGEAGYTSQHLEEVDRIKRLLKE